MQTHRAVAAIDFGTHATGFAWTVVDARNADASVREVYVHNRWAAQPIAYPKTLTALLLDGEGGVRAWGFDARRQWAAHRAGAGEVRLRYEHGFKMLLAANAADASVDPVRRGGGRADDPRRLIASYLAGVYELALGVMAESGYTADDIRWCLTVPAMWDDYQKQVMREAAIEAGLPGEEGRLLLALEPEAAAYHARVSGVRTPGKAGQDRSSLLLPGSRFMVVDCGGGTVDITSYRTDDRGWLVEIGRAHGDKLGSEYINRAFVQQILAARFGSFDVIQRINEEIPAALLGLVDAWEAEKLHVTVDQSEDIYLPIPASIYARLDADVRAGLERAQNGVDDHIVVTPAEATAMFEHVVSGTVRLVDRALADLRAQGAAGERPLLVLVGGFGESPYLQQRLVAHLNDQADVLVPPNPSVAVLFGAVHFAYDPQTLARKARFTYGCAAYAPFREGVDPESRRMLREDGTPRCTNRYDVFVSAGQTVPVDQKVVRTYTPFLSTVTQLVIRIFATRAPHPEYVDVPGCQEIGRLMVDLASVDHLPLDQREVVVGMRFGDTEIHVTATKKLGGEVVDTRLQFDSLSPQETGGPQD